MKALQARSSQRIPGPVPSRQLALRTHPLVFGIVLFLASDLMIFGGFIAGYFNLKGLADAWPPAGVHLDETAGAVGTALLAASSGSMLFVTHFIAQNRFAIARLWLGTSMLLGTAFVLLSVHGWTIASFRIDTNAYGSVYYTTLGFHVFHVSVGVLLMTMLFFNMHKAAFQRDRRAGVEAIGFFWHFVFGIWLLVWGTIFVIR
ncbi:MAG: cytochrome c oxidase subunit 3 [Candidatus Eremiobacteraeota bacterium]|nr:cytochrome c oxidase subunit 3 [Candidatus Eremiobacteraeota bacterium]